MSEPTDIERANFLDEIGAAAAAAFEEFVINDPEGARLWLEAGEAPADPARAEWDARALGERPRPFETDEEYLARARAKVDGEQQKAGLVEIDGEVKLAPQTGETLAVPSGAG